MTDGAFSDPREHLSTPVHVPEPTLLDLVGEWADTARFTREKYVEAVRAAYEGGHTYAAIGTSAGVTSDAIRMLLKRS